MYGCLFSQKEMSSLIPKKIREMEYRIEVDPSKGMKVPVTIYADDKLLQKMLTDRTIQQAVNVSTIPGVLKHVVVLPDGHEGYGFPVGGVAAMDAKEGMISPGGVGYDTVLWLESKGVDLIELSDEELHVCTPNLLPVGPGRVIVSAVNLNTTKELRKRGIEVIELDLTEFAKGGGGPTCLTLPLIRD